MMNSFVGAVVGLLLAAASADGLYISMARYSYWYGDFDRGYGFRSNPVSQEAYNSDYRVGAFRPSSAEVVVMNQLEFPLQERPEETRIFTGIINVPPCRSGIYRFRITSDDDTDMFFDRQHVLENPGRHKGGATTKEAVVHLRGNTDHQFELWWGNYGGPSTLSVEVCYSAAASLQAKQQGLKASGDGSEVKLEDLELLASMEDSSCQYTKDLSTIFTRQDLPTIQRCEFKGYQEARLLPASHMTKSLAVVPTGCTHEAGGVIDLKVPDEDGFVDVTYMFTMLIKVRATGLHTFWLNSDDGSSLLITGKRVVDNSGRHDDRSRQGHIHLKKGDIHVIEIYYGNAVKNGHLLVHWIDPIATTVQNNFGPLLMERW